MKKFIFGLLATVLLSNLSFGQSKETELILSIDPVKIGQLHNEVLSGLHQIQRDNPTLSLKDALLRLDLSLSNEERIAIFDYISKNQDVNQNYSNVIASLKSEKAKEIYRNMNNSIEKNTNYSSLVKSIDDELKIANSQLSGVDLKIIQIFGETSKASADYWYNVYQQPNGKYSPPKWVRKDGNAIAQASLGWAVVAALATGPAAPWTYFVSVGVGGALGSIWPD